MSQSEYALELQNISKAFFGVPALSDVSISIRQGEIHSVIGENGAGKSTMMNIIGGVLASDGGEMRLWGEAYTPKRPSDAKAKGIAFIHQELSLFTNLTILENVYINQFERYRYTPLIKKAGMRSRVKQMLESIDLHVSPDTLVEKLAPGERQLVEIAKALGSDPGLFIFDEPTTSLTSRETEKLFGILKRLRQSGKSIIYISHILQDVKQLSDAITVLRDGSVTSHGKASDYSIDSMVSAMVGRDIKHLYPTSVPIPRDTSMLKVKNLTQPGIVKDISFDLRAGEILGVFGLMGSGRSEMARMIFGIDEYAAGEIIIKEEKLRKHTPQNCIRSGMAFVTENRREEGLLMEFPVFDNMALVDMYRYAKGPAQTIRVSKMTEPVQNAIEELHIKCFNAKKHQTKALSGGNQQKVVIGKWLVGKPDIFIVDEPTRGIDVGTKSEVYGILNTLANDGACILLISSELEELIGVCSRVLVMSKGEIVGEFNKDEFNTEAILRSAFRQFPAQETEVSV